MANIYTGKTVMEAINNISTSDDIPKDNIYERKYKEALEWMRSVYIGLHGAIKEDAEHYFPELKENEDEYIRKRIINALRGDVLDIEETIKAITWLEEQNNKTINVDLLTNVLRKHLYTCVNKTNTYVRSEEDHISLSELINKIRADLIID